MRLAEIEMKREIVDATFSVFVNILYGRARVANNGIVQELILGRIEPGRHLGDNAVPYISPSIASSRHHVMNAATERIQRHRGLFPGLVHGWGKMNHLVQGEARAVV